MAARSLKHRSLFLSVWFALASLLDHYSDAILVDRWHWDMLALVTVNVTAFTTLFSSLLWQLYEPNGHVKAFI